MQGAVASDEPRDQRANSLYNRHQHRDIAPPGDRNEKSMESTFTWIPLYSELAGLLVDWEDRQPELIACLDNLRSDGVKVTPMNDKDKDGANSPLKNVV